MSAPKRPVDTRGQRVRISVTNRSNNRAAIGWRGLTETGAGSRSGIRDQGELGHEQDGTGDVLHAEIHLGLIVRKYPEGGEALSESGGLCVIVAPLYTDEDQNAGTNAGDC